MNPNPPEETELATLLRASIIFEKRQRELDKKPMQRRLVSGEEAEDTLKQHRKPCADCPFARTALRGWLGSKSVQEWISALHGESLIDCHVTKRWQCAGAAIYRANVCKSPLKPNLILKPDKSLVFASPMEFAAHHKSKLDVIRPMAPDEYFDERGNLRRDRGYGKKGEVE